jgi:hypothetical protein
VYFVRKISELFLNDQPRMLSGLLYH